MKRILLLLTAVLISNLVINAAPITSRQAAKNVREFIYSRQGMLSSAAPLQVTASDDNIAPYYIFNIGDNNGFVIASGDDATCSILGYSSNGHVDMAEMPENMKVWLEGYALDIKKIQSLNLPARNDKRIGLKTRANIPAMVTSRWGQDAPYNGRTPLSQYYDPCPTGCVATAIAQVMYYHKWPQDLTAEIPAYTYQEFGSNGVEKHEKKLAPTLFDWDSMKDTYDYNSDQKSKDAVAELMRYVGQSVKMQYGPMSSGAYATDIAPALMNLFGYKNTANIKYREYYSPEGWEDIVYNELANNRPLIYYGATKSRTAAHQFVCDGYEEKNGEAFFHINWGWDGVSDGFFKLSILDPEDQGTGGAGDGMSLSELQSAIFGVERPVENDAFSVNEVEVVRDSTAALDVIFKNVNNNYTSLNFDITLPEGIYMDKDENGRFMCSFEESRSENKDHSVTVTDKKNGVYNIEVSSPTKSHIIGRNGSLLTIMIKTAADIAPDSYAANIGKVSMINDKLEESEIAGCKFNIKVKIKEISGDANYDGKVDIADFNTIIDNIIYKNTKPFVMKLADVDKDGMLDINDAMLTLDIILKDSGKERNIIPTELDYSDAFSLDYNEKGLSLLLSNKTGFKALQFDITLPSEIKIEKTLPAVERVDGFVAVCQWIFSGKYRIMLYSDDSKCISPDEGKIADIITDRLVPNAKITNVVMVTSDLRKMLLNDADYQVPTCIENIAGENNDNIVYTLQGVRVKCNINALPKGVYIVNGRKMVKR